MPTDKDVILFGFHGDRLAVRLLRGQLSIALHEASASRRTVNCITRPVTAGELREMAALMLAAADASEKEPD